MNQLEKEVNYPYKWKDFDDVFEIALNDPNAWSIHIPCPMLDKLRKQILNYDRLQRGALKLRQHLMFLGW